MLLFRNSPKEKIMLCLKQQLIHELLKPSLLKKKSHSDGFSLLEVHPQQLIDRYLDF